MLFARVSWRRSPDLRVVAAAPPRYSRENTPSEPVRRLSGNPTPKHGSSAPPPSPFPLPQTPAKERARSRVTAVSWIKDSIKNFSVRKIFKEIAVVWVSSSILIFSAFTAKGTGIILTVGCLSMRDCGTARERAAILARFLSFPEKTQTF